MSAVCLYSGGMDSFTLIHKLKREEDKVLALMFNYGQRHIRELRAAKQVCASKQIPYEVVDLRDLGRLVSTSSLTGDSPVPEGHYASSNMKQTVVPGRNTIMLSIGLGLAQSRGFSKVAYAAHAGDHEIYPDCRPEYTYALNSVFYRASEGAVRLDVPFLVWTKGEILVHGLSLGLDYSQTWTCYKGGHIACGRCGSCVERLHAFDEARATDPLEYIDRASYLTFEKE